MGKPENSSKFGSLQQINGNGATHNTQVNTDGGAYIDGGVSIKGDFIGRDKVTQILRNHPFISFIILCLVVLVLMLALNSLTNSAIGDPSYTPTPTKTPQSSGEDSFATPVPAVLSPTILPPRATPTPVCTTTTQVNLRSGDGVNFTILKLLMEHKELTPLAINPDSTWIKVSTDEIIGWISADLANCNVELNSLATQSPSSPTFVPTQPAQIGHGQIKMGMTYEEVVAILGQPSKLLMQVRSEEVYQWGTGFLPNIVVIFDYGKVIEVTQPMLPMLPLEH